MQDPLGATPAQEPPAGVHSLWRLRGYLRPHATALIIMLIASLGGVALRFARVLRYRDDKGAAEADTIEAVRGHVAP